MTDSQLVEPDDLSDCARLPATLPAFRTCAGGSSAAGQGAHAALRLAMIEEMMLEFAHDFRNILTVIDASLRLAAGAGQSEPMRASIAAAREGVSRGAKLAEQLVTFTRQGKCAPQAGDANELLITLAPLLEHGVGPGIRISLDLARDIPKCLVDPTQFSAALINLVLNARDAMPDGGPIRIATQRWAETEIPGRRDMATYVRVRVEDSGQGMSDDVLRHIFVRFFTTKAGKGTGLGLPQVRAFMRSIGGHINVVSERGKGTRFDLFLPAIETPVSPRCKLAFDHQASRDDGTIVAGDQEAAGYTGCASVAETVRNPSSAGPSTASSALAE